jgi:hypothetical protein
MDLDVEESLDPEEGTIQVVLHTAASEETHEVVLHGPNYQEEGRKEDIADVAEQMVVLKVLPAGRERPHLELGLVYQLEQLAKVEVDERRSVEARLVS